MNEYQSKSTETVGDVCADARDSLSANYAGNRPTTRSSLHQTAWPLVLTYIAIVSVKTAVRYGDDMPISIEWKHRDYGLLNAIIRDDIIF